MERSDLKGIGGDNRVALRHKTGNRVLALAFAAVTLALSSSAQAATCGKEVSDFAWEMGNRRLPLVAAGPFFPPSREAERLLVVSSLYRAAQSMERLGKARQCLELLAEARGKLESLNEGIAPR